MKMNNLIDKKDIPLVRTNIEKINYCIICVYEWIVALFAMVFILPIALLVHMFKLMYLMYTEFYMNFRSYSDEFDFYSLKDIWSNINCMFKPQTPHVIKHISFYHVDKPELIEDFIIDCFKEFVESEHATNPNVGPALSVKITKEIYDDIKRLEQMHEKCDHCSLLNPYWNKYDAFKLNIVNRIMKHHKDMWT